MKAMKTIGTVAVVLATGAGAAAAAGGTHEAKGRIEHLNPRAQHLTVGPGAVWGEAQRDGSRAPNLANG